MSESHPDHPSRAPSEAGDASVATSGGDPYDSDEDDRKVIFRGRYNNGYSDKIPELKKPHRGARPKFDPYTLQYSSMAPANITEELTRSFHGSKLNTVVAQPLAMFPRQKSLITGAFFPATKEQKPRALTEIGM